jgi:hypothetical protein
MSISLPATLRLDDVGFIRRWPDLFESGGQKGSPMTRATLLGNFFFACLDYIRLPIR